MSIRNVNAKELFEFVMSKDNPFITLRIKYMIKDRVTPQDFKEWENYRISKGYEGTHISCAYLPDNLYLKSWINIAASPIKYLPKNLTAYSICIKRTDIEELPLDMNVNYIYVDERFVNYFREKYPIYGNKIKDKQD